MKLFSNDLEAAFLDRPNRFLVRAEHCGEVVAAHCPNPGRMQELLLPGRTLILERKEARAGLRTPFTLAAALYRGGVVPLVSAAANRVARHLVFPRLYPGWTVAPEVRAGASRLDFRLEEASGGKRRRYVEVKACTLVEHGTAMFPDAPTRRGLRHLEELASLSRTGAEAEVLVVIMSPEAERFVPNLHTDPELSARLIELAGGVEVKAVSVRCSREGEARLERLAVPVDLQAAAPAAADAGSYLLVLEALRDTSLRVGALGTLLLPAGYHVYVGSAMGGLKARLARHRRRRKRLHWHIDYLLAAPGVGLRAVLPVRSRRRLECDLARELGSAASGAVPGFGSSDCGCSSHLYRFAADPMSTPAFLQVLLRYRHAVAL